MRSRVVRPVLLLSLVGACEARLPDQSPAGAPTSVNSSVVLAPSTSRLPSWVGVVRRPSLTLTAPDAATVARVHVALGSVVDAGELLVELEQPRLETELEQLRARRLEAVAALAAAKLRERHRAADLQADQSAGTALTERELRASQQGASEAASERASATARLRVLEAETASLERRLAAGRLRAPFAGRVTSLAVSPGVRVDEGTQLLRLIEQAPAEVRFAVSPDQLVELGGVGTTVEVRLDPPTDLSWMATVERIAPEVDTVAQMITVEARVHEDAPVLRAGQACVVTPITEPG